MSGDGLFSELHRWEPAAISRLYQSPFAVQCVLRCLPPLARLTVLRLVPIPPDCALLPDQMRAWFASKAIFEQTIRALISTRIVLRDQDTAELRMAPLFADKLRQALAATVPPPFAADEKAPAPMSNDDLDKYASQKWETLLHYLAATENARAPSPDVAVALVRTNLQEQVGRDGLQITNVGFQFLLKDLHAQVWLVVIELVDILAGRNRDPMAKGEILELLFRLGFAVVGKAYPIDPLTRLEQEAMETISQLGGCILKDGFFFPTRIGTQMVLHGQGKALSSAGGPSTATMGSSNPVRVVVETNFRIYAYTQSSFQIVLLKLLANMKYRLPDMAVGHITRDSVRTALTRGIRADQIIGYLNAHAHSKMTSGRIPPNVADQIRLWEAEADRISFERSTLFQDFDTDGKGFRVAVKHAEDFDALLWADHKAYKMVVRRDFAKKVAAFIQAQNLR